MAYKIKGNREGHYYVLYFSLPSQSVEQLNRENRLHEDLLRFMNLSVPLIPEGNEIFFKSIQLEK